jgi:hypothetical protein
MTIELLYTSAAQGLKQGSRGFCTVVCTAGLPINLAQRLESLSGYRHLYQPGDQHADDNPVCHSHIRLAVGGKTLSILSRVGAYGVDYSQRTNKIAHHVVFDAAVPACGPAAVLSQAGIMRTDWDGECKTLQNGPHVPPLELQPAPCQEWQRITGDAGWAGVVANAWLQPTGKPVWIVFSESQSASLLDLMQEATAILPESRRWQATFSTYCTNLPPDVECRVRCVIAGSDEARMSIARGTVLDLTKPMGVALDNDAVNAARHGFTIGATSNFVPSVPELPNVSDQNMEEIEAALSAHASDGNEYQLQQQIPGRLPIPLAMPNRRPGNNVNRKGLKSQNLQSNFWKVFAVAAGILVFLSLVGTGVFYIATTKNPLAGIVERIPKETPEQATDKPEDDPQNKDVASDSSSTEASAADNDSKDSQQTRPSLEVMQTIITEIVDDSKTAKLEESIAKAPDAKLEIVVTNIGDGIPAESVYANERLKAKVMPEDSNGLKDLKFLWQGRKNNSKEWEKLANADKDEYVVSPDYSAIRCRLNIESSIPDAMVAEGKEIKVKNIGLATLDFHELFFATSDKPCVLRFENPFYNLPTLNRGEVFQAEWHKGIKQPLEGNILKSTVELRMVANQQPRSNHLELPSAEFKAKNVGTANHWLMDACERSIEVRRSLQNLIGVLPSMPRSSLLSIPFRSFVNELKESPSDSVQRVLELDSWIKELEAFKGFREKPPKKESPTNDTDKSQDEIEFERLQTKFMKFETAFSQSPFMSAKNVIGDTQVEDQALSFCKDLNSIANKTPPRTVKDEWRNFCKAIVALKQVMEDSARFEVDIESASPIRILKILKNPDPASSNRPEEVYKDTFRIKLKVNFPNRK